MAKRRNIFAFHFWLNLAMEDVFLAHLLGLSAERIVKPGTCSRPSGACAKWNGREERGQTSRLPRGILAASWRLPVLSNTVWLQQRKWQRVIL